MRKKISFSSVVCLVFVLAACDQNSETLKSVAQPEPHPLTEQCHLRMGWYPWEPYHYLNPDNEVVGLEIDLLGAMAKLAGCDIELVQDSWMNLLAGIRSGSIDMLGSATKTVARARFAYFSDSYRHESFILYVRTGESEQYAAQSLQQLVTGEFRLGVTQDYIYGDQVSAIQDDEELSANIVSVPITEMNYYNLTQYNIDGFLEDPFVAVCTIKRKGLQGQIEAHSIEIPGSDVAIMFSKKGVKAETVQAFNEALAQLKEMGEYQKILAKYSHYSSPET